MEYKIEIGEHNKPEKVNLILNEDEESVNIKKQEDKKEYDSELLAKKSYNQKMREADIPEPIKKNKSTDDNSTETVLKNKISGKKIWLDDSSKNRPESIVVYLLANNQLFDKKVVTAEDQWKYHFTNLPLYDQSGEKIDYRIEEKAIRDYRSIVHGHNIENLRVGKIEARIVKDWPNSIKSNELKDIKIDLIRNGKKIKEINLSAKTNWEHHFRALDKYDFEGKEYQYHIDEPMQSESIGHPAKLIIGKEDLSNERKARNTGIALVAGTVLAVIGLASQIKNKLKK